MNRWMMGMLAVLAMLPMVAQAQTSCQPTPSIAVHDYPGPRPIPTSNDLTRPTGKAVAAEGQVLVLQGRLYDNRCVPLQGATIELWQANPFGKWRLISGQDRATPNSVFASAGRTYTDNNGMFEFITLFPGVMEKNGAPHVHLRVMAQGMKPFTTALYFANDNRNATDPAFKRLSIEARARAELAMQPINGDANGGFVGRTNIVLPEAAKYRTY